MTEEEFFISNYPDSCYGDKPLSPHFDFFQDGVEFGERESEEKIAELELQLEREKKLNLCLSDDNEQLREQIKKMKCCANCMYEPPFDEHCDECTLGMFEIMYRNWKLREQKK